MRRASDRERPVTANPQGPARAAVTDPWAAQGEGGNTQVVLAFDDNRLATQLFGHYGRNLALLERKLGVKAESRGNHLTLEGPRDSCEQARRVLEYLYEHLKRGRDVGPGDVDGAIREAVAQGSLAIGGFQAEGEAAKITRGVPTVGRIANGAIIEREIEFALNRLPMVRLALRNADFTTAKRIAIDQVRRDAALRDLERFADRVAAVRSECVDRRPVEPASGVFGRA